MEPSGRLTVMALDAKTGHVVWDAARSSRLHERLATASPPLPLAVKNTSSSSVRLGGEYGHPRQLWMLTTLMTSASESVLDGSTSPGRTRSTRVHEDLGRHESLEDRRCAPQGGGDGRLRSRDINQALFGISPVTRPCQPAACGRAGDNLYLAIVFPGPGCRYRDSQLVFPNSQNTTRTIGTLQRGGTRSGGHRHRVK